MTGRLNYKAKEGHLLSTRVNEKQRSNIVHALVEDHEPPPLCHQTIHLRRRRAEL
jgi:hypothetical protein